MKRISVVIATYNRANLLGDLLRGLAHQTLPVSRYEVIVVDDGSKEPARPAVLSLGLPYDLRVIEQKNAGPAAARHNGIMEATGEVVVIVDDDMLVAPEFLEAHVAEHERGATLVLGNIADDEELGVRKPLFELFHARTLSRSMRALGEGRVAPRGVHVCTGNVSLRRDEYIAVGGFDRSLPHSEDRELGVRLEKAGARLAFAAKAKTIHRSDRADLDRWFRRSFVYGVCDSRIARKHPDVAIADPWRSLVDANPLSKPFLLVAAVAPEAGRLVSRAAMWTAMQIEKLGADRVAVAGATLSFGIDYFRGVREEAGSLSRASSDFFTYLTKKRG